MLRVLHPDGAKIEQLRLEKGWSTGQLAEAAGMSYHSVWYVEQRSRPCRPVALWRIANALSDSERKITAPDITAPGQDKLSA